VTARPPQRRSLLNVKQQHSKRENGAAAVAGWQ
jgi:hypothetical protein